MPRLSRRASSIAALVIAALAVLTAVAVRALTQSEPRAQPPATIPEPPPSADRVVTTGSWTCDRAVDLALVRVANDGHDDAVTLASGCTGRIGRLEVTGVVNGDGVKIQNRPGAAHDLVVESGSVSCAGPSTDGTHQDGVQAMGGKRITFRDVVFDCFGHGGGNFFVQRAAGPGLPTAIVCDRCALGPRSPNNVNLGPSLSSGVRRSLLCEPLTGRRPIRLRGGFDPIDTGNDVVPSDDPRCASTASLGAWVSG